MRESGGPLRLVLRAILTLTLLLGGGAGFWMPEPAAEAHACCCGEAAGQEDACPCPKPERAPGQQRTNPCGQRTPAGQSQAPVAAQALRQGEQRQRHAEARPEPRAWILAEATQGSTATPAIHGGRDPDLGRHLATLGVFRI